MPVWTCKARPGDRREAFGFKCDPDWGQVYERDLVHDIEFVGTETFYPPLDL